MRRRSGGVVRALVLLGVALVIGAGVVAYLLRDQPPDTTARDAPSIEPANLMKTGGVEKSIRDRLSARTGREVVAECPDAVDALTGTTFTCEAWYADEPDVRSIVTVTITGGGGAFEWTAEREPSPEATSPPDGVDAE